MISKVIFHIVVVWWMKQILFMFFFLIWSIDEGPSLPTSANEEFRPFIRRLPEFKFWYLVFFLVDYNLWNFNIFLYHTQVFIDNSNINFIDLYVLWILQHTSILAYIVALFYHIVLHNNETTNQSMDKKVFLSLSDFSLLINSMIYFFPFIYSYSIWLNIVICLGLVVKLVIRAKKIPEKFI